MDLENILSMIVNGPALVAALIIVYLYKQESQSLHQSIDNNTNALRELTTLINEMRIEQGRIDQQIDGLWHRYKEIKNELDEVRKCHCKGGE